MPYFSAPKVSDDEALRSYARVLVRSGLAPQDTCVAEVALAAREDAGRDDAESYARELVAESLAALRAEELAWPARTDYDALQDAFAALGAAGYAVLQGIEDHWTVAGVLREAAQGGGALRGAVWFTPSDVWHAIDHEMLEVNVWHADSANIADGDPLCGEVLAAFAEQGLDAHFDEGRIEVRAAWHRRSVGA